MTQEQSWKDKKISEMSLVELGQAKQFLETEIDNSLGLDCNSFMKVMKIQKFLDLVEEQIKTKEAEITS